MDVALVMERAGVMMRGAAASWDEGAAARLLARVARFAALDWRRRPAKARVILSRISDAYGPLIDEAFDSGDPAAFRAALREATRAWRLAAERAEGLRPPVRDAAGRAAWARLLREIRCRDRSLARDVAALEAAGASLEFDHAHGSWRLSPGRMGERAYEMWKARRFRGDGGRARAAALREAIFALPKPAPEEPPGAPARAGFDPSAVEHEVTGSPSDLAEALAAARRAGVAGLDVETMPGPAVAGLAGRWAERAPLDPHLGRIRLVQVAVPGRPVLLFDVRRLWDLPDGERARALAPLAELLADPEIVKVGHNLKFDLQMLRGLFGLGWGRRLRVGGIWDTMLADQLLACGMWAEDGYGLKAVARRRLDVELDKSEQTSDWSRDLTSDQLRYAALDAAVLLPIREAQAAEVGRLGLGRAMRLENEALPAVADLEWAGLGFDQERWEALRDDVRRRAADARARLVALLGRASDGPVQQDLFGGAVEAIDPDSPKQVLEALHRLGIDVPDTRDSTLAAVADREEVRALLGYRELAKALSAFLDPYLELVHPVTGRIHASFHQLNRNGVGRFSASDPNVQQWPRDPEYRACVIPASGRKLVIADYSAIEMRIMARLSGDPGLTRVFQEGADPHRRTAALIMGKPETEVTKEERQLSKSVNFGMLYGMGAAGFQRYAKAQYGVDLTLEEARRFRDAYFRAYPGVAAFHRRQDAVARREMAVRTLSGRMRRWSSHDMPLTELANTPDQGTGADILKRALARVRPHLDRLDGEIVNIVHDEIVLEAPADRAEEARDILAAEMRAAGEEFLYPVPVEVEAEVGESWADK
ncbi:MAG: DNA polymerase [Bacillota bacterium]|nr:DNA polymerase [Bacillota bacterium]